MDGATTTQLRYRIELRTPGRAGRVLGSAFGLRAAARAFEDEFARLAHAGERGTLSLICELCGGDAPIAIRRIMAGIAG